MYNENINTNIELSNSIMSKSKNRGLLIIISIIVVLMVAGVVWIVKK